MQKSSQDVVIVNATRTAIGKFNGMWGNKEAHDLGKIVITDILKQTSIKPDEIDEVILGQVLTSNVGQNPARQAAIGAKIPYDKISYIVKKFKFAPVAQLDRALGYGPGGSGFDS